MSKYGINQKSKLLKLAIIRIIKDGSSELMMSFAIRHSMSFVRLTQTIGIIYIKIMGKAQVSEPKLQAAYVKRIRVILAPVLMILLLKSRYPSIKLRENADVI